MLRRIGVLTSLAVTAAMFASVSTASATPGDEFAVCVFDGLSGALQPPISNLPSPLQHGTYNFQGRGNCAGRDEQGDVLQPSAGGTNVTITSAGDYDNIQCGTGWAYDTGGDASTTVTPDNSAFPTIQGVGYEITFVGGTGPLRIGTGVATAPSALGQPLAGNYAGAGVVNIVPVNHTSPTDFGCATAPTAEFEVTGSFAAASKN